MLFNVTQLSLSSNLKEIGRQSFWNFKQLESLNIPDSVERIGSECFFNCYSLTSITLGSNWSLQGNYIVNNLPFFSMFEAPENLKVLNGKEIEIKEGELFIIPSCVTKLDDRLFDHSNFKSISFETTSLKELPKRCFSDCWQLKEITIPFGVTKLGEYCFYNCSNLTLISLPSSITSFGDSCFYRSGIKQEEYPNLPKHCWE